jgi:TM2 domain-containing membrane protein YozV
MEQTKIDMFISTHGKKFSSDKIGIIQSQLEKIDDKKFLSVQSANYHSSANLIIISFFLGGLGIDRFIIGHTALGVIKLLTFGGAGFWWLIDLFIISKAGKSKNFFTFTQIAN